MGIYYKFYIMVIFNLTLRIYKPLLAAYIFDTLEALANRLTRFSKKKKFWKGLITFSSHVPLISKSKFLKIDQHQNSTTIENVHTIIRTVKDEVFQFIGIIFLVPNK